MHLHQNLQKMKYFAGITPDQYELTIGPPHV